MQLIQLEKKDFKLFAEELIIITYKNSDFKKRTEQSPFLKIGQMVWLQNLH